MKLLYYCFLFSLISLLLSSQPMKGQMFSLLTENLDFNSDNIVPSKNSNNQESKLLGNKLSLGGNLLNNKQIFDIKLLGIPIWINSIAIGDSSFWLIGFKDGRMQGFVISIESYREIQLLPKKYKSEYPPNLILKNNQIYILEPPIDSSRYTQPVVVPNNIVYYLNKKNALVCLKSGSKKVLQVNGLYDSRVLYDKEGRILVLVNPSTRYKHGILGDYTEATGMVILETFPEFKIISEISISSPKVIEGLFPIWTNLNEDNNKEIVVTLSDSKVGAQIVVFNEQGKIVAEAEPIGLGNRWSHQLAAASFGPNGETEIAAILTPHIGGVVEYYQMHGSKLIKVAQLPGFSTHRIGSRNLDMAIAGNFDKHLGDELIVPDQSFKTINILKRKGERVEVLWSQKIGGSLSSNISAVTTNDGVCVIGAGSNNKNLRLWFGL